MTTFRDHDTPTAKEIENLNAYAELRPLPTAETLAAPVMRGLLAIWDAFDDRIATLSFLAEFGPEDDRPRYKLELADALAVASDTAELVATAADGLVPGSSTTPSALARQLIIEVVENYDAGRATQLEKTWERIMSPD